MIFFKKKFSFQNSDLPPLYEGSNIRPHTAGSHALQKYQQDHGYQRNSTLQNNKNIWNQNLDNLRQSVSQAPTNSSIATNANGGNNGNNGTNGTNGASGTNAATNINVVITPSRINEENELENEMEKIGKVATEASIGDKNNTTAVKTTVAGSNNSNNNNNINISQTDISSTKHRSPNLDKQASSGSALLR